MIGLSPCRQGFLSGEFKKDDSFNLLIATHTLAYGVNLPVDRVVVVTSKIKTDRGWIIWPDPLDIRQMEGRAGRLGLRDKGESKILA